MKSTIILGRPCDVEVDDYVDQGGVTLNGTAVDGAPVEGPAVGGVPIEGPAAEEDWDISPYPTPEPTINPTLGPTFEPKIEEGVLTTAPPTLSPTFQPSFEPTQEPTQTSEPTIAPTFGPTFVPEVVDGVLQTASPTFAPTLIPTDEPTLSPTMKETLGATLEPCVDSANFAVYAPPEFNSLELDASKLKSCDTFAGFKSSNMKLVASLPKTQPPVAKKFDSVEEHRAFYLAHFSKPKAEDQEIVPATATTSVSTAKTNTLRSAASTI